MNIPFILEQGKDSPIPDVSRTLPKSAFRETSGFLCKILWTFFNSSFYSTLMPTLRKVISKHDIKRSTTIERLPSRLLVHS